MRATLSSHPPPAAAAPAVRSAGPAFPPWVCVVEKEQVWRENRSGVLFEVISVSEPAENTANASVILCPVDARPGTEDLRLNASVLCGGAAWSRLPDEDELATAFFDKTRVGVGPAPIRRAP